MKIILIAALSLGLLSCATSHPDPLKPWRPVSGEKFQIINLHQETLQRVCETMGDFVTPPGWSIHGCVTDFGQVLRRETCLIFMDGDLFADDYNLVLRHEQAHCRGWQHGQPFPEGELG